MGLYRKMTAAELAARTPAHLPVADTPARPVIRKSAASVTAVSDRPASGAQRVAKHKAAHADQVRERNRLAKQASRAKGKK